MWPFVCMIAVQLMVASLSVATLSGIRSALDVAGLIQRNHNESLYHLARYINTGIEHNFDEYVTSLDVLMDAHEARIAVIGNDSNKLVKIQKLYRLPQSQDDAYFVMWLIDCFNKFDFIKDGLTQFVYVDELTSRLKNIGDAVRHAVVETGMTPAAAAAWSSEIDQIQQEGGVYFSTTIALLARTARIVEAGLIVVNLSLAAMLAALTTWRVKRFLGQRRAIESSLAWQASHDVLTGIANRRAFEQRLDEVTRVTAEPSSPKALMFIDLDQFKIVNDTCGHAAGDALLQRICAPLQDTLGPNDLLARLGGDEFSILLTDCTMQRALEVAEAMRAAVEHLGFTWGLRAFRVTASIGVVHSDHSIASAEDMMRAADMACYLAKEKGRNRVHVHRDEDADLVRHAGEMNWVQRIHQALNESRFCLYAQDIAPLGGLDEGGMHVELLLRLRDETGAIVPPASFLPAAERFGLMTLIDRWVVRQAFELLAARGRDPAAEPVACCAINLSGTTIGDKGFLTFLEEMFAHFDISPSIICFEITETSAIANLAAAQTFVQDLRAIGCRFSLDDFGAGLSSFAYLKHFPVDFLKIDGGFVKNLLNDKIDRAMVEMISHIGHVMGKRVIAEFVENDGLIVALGGIGVDFGQGYGIGRPRPFNPAFRSAVPSHAVVGRRKVA